jgi:hypothetical protein
MDEQGWEDGSSGFFRRRLFLCPQSDIDNILRFAVSNSVIEKRVVHSIGVGTERGGISHRIAAYESHPVGGCLLDARGPEGGQAMMSVFVSSIIVRSTVPAR